MKVNVNNFSCIRNGLDKACDLHKIIDCTINLVDQLLHKETELTFKSFEENSAFGNSSFIGDAISTICTSDYASSYNPYLLLGIVTALVLFEM